MKRTTVYLEEAQAAVLGRAARAQGISRAKLIRQLIDYGVGGSGADDLEADLAAIREAFGVLHDEDAAALVRGTGERSRHQIRGRGGR
jgi:hypothetical protein